MELAHKNRTENSVKKVRKERTNKNHSLQGVTQPPGVGSDLETDVVTGTIMPGGHVTQTGRGVVVVDDVVDGDGVCPGGGGVGKAVAKRQSWVNTPTEGARKVIIFLVGHVKAIGIWVYALQLVVRVALGVANVIRVIAP